MPILHYSLTSSYTIIYTRLILGLLYTHPRPIITILRDTALLRHRVTNDIRGRFSTIISFSSLFTFYSILAICEVHSKNVVLENRLYVTVLWLFNSNKSLRPKSNLGSSQAKTASQSKFNEKSIPIKIVRSLLWVFLGKFPKLCLGKKITLYLSQFIG